MFQRTPRDGLTFASFWIGARLAKLEGDGQFNLVAHGPALTKTNSHWWSVEPLGKEQNLFSTV